MKKEAKKKAVKPAKKTAKKKAVKKAVKKTTKKTPAKGKVKVCIKTKMLGRAPEEQCFYLEDGRKLKNVYELIDELETMTDDMFRKHVNEFKNDFANWMEHVFDRKTIADEMREIENRLDTQRALLKELVRELKKHHDK